MTKYAPFAIATLLLISASCKKSDTDKTTSGATLYGLSSNLDDLTTRFGMINEGSASISGVGSISGQGYSAAYNTTDSCYYAFAFDSIHNLSPHSNFYKISNTGVVTILTNTSSIYYEALTYNGATNTFYAINGTSLVAINTTATSYTATNVVTPIHKINFDTYAPPNITCNNTTEDVYYITGDTSTFYVEKYHPGAAASVVVATGTGFTILGLKFNKNDNMLYAVRENYPAPGNNFIKVDPATGNVTTLAAITEVVNVDFFSACIDTRTNRYIYSSLYNNTNCLLVQLDMTGTLIQKNSTLTFYHGLEVY